MNIKINLPADVKYIINTLYANGEEAYAVGGSVRDALLGKKPKDWDICTSAKPTLIKQIFEHTVDTGIRHGTVTVVLPCAAYEVTTYRIDGNYIDNRHPENVSFVKSLKDDLQRRDFTINAMAYNDINGLRDFCGGCNDLKNKSIRCVGNPDTRFNEDALRIMRAVRFSAELMFDIEPETAQSAIRNRHLLSGIAVERLSCELFKLIDGNGYDKTVKKFFDILNIFLYDCNLTNTLNKPKNLRLFALFDAADSAEAMQRLKLPAKTISDILNVIQCPPPKSLAEARVLYGKIGGENLKNVLLYHGHSTDFADIIENNNLCCRIKDLNINGRDIIRLTGKNGKQIGEALSMLLDAVIHGKIKNEYLSLKNYLLTKEE